MVDARAEPGPVRDRYYRHGYRGKVLLRLGRRQDPVYQAQVYAAARALIEDCFPPRLDDGLAFNLRLRARLVRRDDRAGLNSLVAFESGLRARARVLVARPRGDGLDLVVAGRLRRAGRRAIAVTRRGERLGWEPPPELAPTLDDDDRDVTETLDGQVGVVLRSQQDETEWPRKVGMKGMLQMRIDPTGELPEPMNPMANELGRHGIRVNCVNPAITLTDMARKAWSDPEKVGPYSRAAWIWKDGALFHRGDAARRPVPDLAALGEFVREQL